MRLGFKRPLYPDDIYALPPQDDVGLLCRRFHTYWDRERATKAEPSLVRTAGREFLLEQVQRTAFSRGRLVECKKTCLPLYQQKRQEPQWFESQALR